jgi:hypothetical protein
MSLIKNKIKNDLEFQADYENFLYSSLLDNEKDVLNKILALLQASFKEVFVEGLDLFTEMNDSIEVDVLKMPQSKIMQRAQTINIESDSERYALVVEFSKLTFKINYIMVEFFIQKKEIKMAIIINDSLLNTIEKMESRFLEDLSPYYQSYLKKTSEQKEKLALMLNQNTNSNSMYTINTGDIFQNLKYEWKRYDRNFIQELEMTIHNLLMENDIVTAHYRKGENENYIINYRDIRYPRAQKEAENENNFPIPDFFLRFYETDSDYPSIVSYNENCIVPKDDDSFVKFFALKLSLTDEMEIKNFLEYQLEENFNKNKNEYKEFLELILIKYKEFLVNGKTDVITNKYIMEKLSDTQNEEIKNVQKEKSNSLSPIKWTNSTNKNDFVKIIYALHGAKLINNGEGEITKIVEQAATAFGVELSKSWQSNFSKSKNDQNADYDQTSVFDKMKTAYQDYLNKNRKN